jgi:hypothetical protein
LATGFEETLGFWAAAKLANAREDIRIVRASLPTYRSKKARESGIKPGFGNWQGAFPPNPMGWA